ncbi:MAG TPA: outer membrane protein assembly factor BamA [Verrucomicrobiae bacterium]|nr:outer membrane protein assembly factor BamA [Verrucomicrobiae bacterium]
MARLFAALLLLGYLQPALAQFAPPRISKVEIRHVGPATVSDALIRANIKVKAGDPYLAQAIDDDVKNLYATGFFYNIEVSRKDDPNGNGSILTYVVQEKPRLTAIRITGNTKFKDAKLRKKLTSKIGEPLDERKLFTDAREIEKRYQSAGYPSTRVEYSFNIEQDSGRATATLTVHETPKLKITAVEFLNAHAFTQKKLRKQIKTRRHWMFSWITRHGFLKDDVLEEDRDRLREFYRDHGYLDFEIKDVQFVHPKPGALIVRFVLYEGQQYKVGSVKFTGNKLFTIPEIISGLHSIHAIEHQRGKVGTNGLPMDVGDIFTPKGFNKDVQAVQDLYGSKGYIDVTPEKQNLTVNKIPNTERGTMDLEFNINEGQKSYIEKIEIRGNTRTKDKVIRRELSVSPGEVFDMTRVNLSKQRLENLKYFSRVDLRPEPTEPPIAGRKDLVVGVEEQNTGNFTIGAAFSSIDELVGFAELYQGNFDLFNPPTFTGGGQKFRLRIAVGTLRQDYVAEFIEPWFLGRKLALSTQLYRREADYESLNDMYIETRTGATIGLSKALGSDFLTGGINYTIEDVGIRLNDGFFPIPTNRTDVVTTTNLATGVVGTTTNIVHGVPPSILKSLGDDLLSRVRVSLAYDTRNSVELPNKGQRTELTAEMVGGPLGGDHEFYKLNLQTAWYFRGFFPGHVLEIVGRGGVAQSLEGDDADVPFYERFYLGGLDSMRGFRYRSVGPREAGFSEPVGGDTYWFGSAEYSIPVFQQDKERGIGVRLAFFYDFGAVASRAYNFSDLSNFDDNYGIGLHLNLPIGPLRLDYGIPIHHDQYNGTSGKFQFGVGYTRAL